MSEDMVIVPQHTLHDKVEEVVGLIVALSETSHGIARLEDVSSYFERVFHVSQDHSAQFYYVCPINFVKACIQKFKI